MTADTLRRPHSFKFAPTLLYKRRHERREEVEGPELVALVHDEVICLVSEEHAQRAARWRKGMMETVADAVVNGNLPPDERVPMKADTSVCESWGDK